MKYEIISWDRDRRMGKESFREKERKMRQEKTREYCTREREGWARVARKWEVGRGRKREEGKERREGGG